MAVSARDPVAAAPAAREQGSVDLTARAATPWPLFFVLAGALALRLALTPLYANLPDGTLDEGFWMHWMERIEQHGVINIFRTSDTDYVGYHWVLWLLNLVYAPFGDRYDPHAPGLHLLVKVPPLVFDLVLIALVYRVTEVLASVEGGADARVARRLGLVAAGVMALQPAALYDSAVWAQTDAAIAAAMLAGLYFAWRGAPLVSGAAYALGLAVKPHPVIVAPLLALTLWRTGGWRALLRFGLAVLGVSALVLGPWLLHGDGGRIMDVYTFLFTQERFRLSELAWNGWWIVDQAGDPRPGSAIFGPLPLITYARVALALSAGATLLGFAYAARKATFAALLVAGAYQAFAFYMLPVGSHERYLYPFLALLLPAALIDRRWLWLYVPVSLTLFANLFVVAPPVDAWEDRWVYGSFGVVVSMVNVGLFAAFTVALLVSLIGGSTGLRRGVPSPLRRPGEVPALG